MTVSVQLERSENVVPHPKGPSTLLGIGLVGSDILFGYLDSQGEGFGDSPLWAVF